jgi:chlorophyll synthase
MTLPQVIVMALLFRWGLPAQGCAIAGLLIAQLMLMASLMTDPRGLAPWYNATGTSLYVAGMMVVAVALQPALGAMP